MRKAKIIRLICDILIVIFLLGFVFALFWYLCGSFEMIPTDEQQEKAWIGVIRKIQLRREQLSKTVWCIDFYN